MTEQQIIVTLATKVMGWKRYQETDFWFGDNGNLFNSSLWNPLENIAAAFQVMDKLCIELIPQAGNPPKDMKYLAIFDDSPIGPKIEVFAKTAQKAICKVAMKVVA
ncbi:BC1872 family protein [Brevibacillus laterosporus]|uniref:BC1872 family protein n=1 Tax=Brevibacillus laterosporus TaxID=1465 RepID=UPI000E6C42CF|nr:hypothetical protein [Brevibacillus laterosporus]AYB39702.1 hypothetical protein D5F52_16275 [Brevibacillus laterosporus]MBM7109129.1 hypothetical protein [Brevibacillus laterosporus]